MWLYEFVLYPLSTEGGHSAAGCPVFKRLVSWDNSVGVVLDEPNGSASNNIRRQTYNFAKSILGTDATQEEVYDQSARDIVNDFVDNYNGLVFAYGQTGNHEQ